MAPHSRNLKTKEVKIPHLTVANRKKMETWGLGGLFAVDWSGTYEKLVEELADREMLNAILAPIRPEHFQHNLLAFYHHAWAAITNPAAPTPDWGDAVEKTVSRQIKALGICKASGSKPLDLKIDYDEWGICLESLGHETSKLFEAFHVEVSIVIAEAVARNMKEMFAPPPVAEADI
ncbi:hypothetical protein R1flu_024465 [Riccia fluitans]|uniref:Uncharacterized protein n=1 Tax=Riccia fluitans TaxID=41844 RepID=A0ABD1XUY5_9MARC